MRDGAHDYTERKSLLILYATRVAGILSISCSFMFICMSWLIDGPIASVVFPVLLYFTFGVLGVATTKKDADGNYPVYTDTRTRLTALKINVFLVVFLATSFLVSFYVNR